MVGRETTAGSLSSIAGVLHTTKPAKVEYATCSATHETRPGTLGLLREGRDPTSRKGPKAPTAL